MFFLWYSLTYWHVCGVAKIRHTGTSPKVRKSIVNILHPTVLGYKRRGRKSSPDMSRLANMPKSTIRFHCVMFIRAGFRPAAAEKSAALTPAKSLAFNRYGGALAAARDDSWLGLVCNVTSILINIICGAYCMISNAGITILIHVDSIWCLFMMARPMYTQMRRSVGDEELNNPVC